MPPSPSLAKAPTQTYSHADVVRWMGSDEVAKGTGYVTHVSALAVDAELITALVQGSARRPYQVEAVFWRDPDGRAGVDGYCSCPVGVDCKHCAAVLLRALVERMGAPESAPAAGRLPAASLAPALAPVNPEVLKWAQEVRKAAADGQKKAAAKKPVDQLFYVLNFAQGVPSVEILKGQAQVGGAPVPSAERWTNLVMALSRPPKFVSAEDLEIFRLLWTPNLDYFYPLMEARGREVITRLLASGRLFFRREESDRGAMGAGVLPLRLGAVRPAALEWRPVPGDGAGRVAPKVVAAPAVSQVLLLDAPWYLDAVAGEAGPLQLPQTVDQLRQLSNMPPLAEADIAVVAQVLDEVAPEVPKPLAPKPLREMAGKPVGLLEFSMHQMWGLGAYREYGYDDRRIACARPRFRYGEAVVRAWDAAEFATLPGGETVRVRRDLKAEKQWLQTLLDQDFLPLPAHLSSSAAQPHQSLYGRESEDAWAGFMAEGLPVLRGAGWEVDIPRDFPHFLLEVSAWSADIQDEENGWLSLNMGIVVEGERLPLAPLLHGLLKRDPRWMEAKALDAMPDQERVELHLPDGRRVGVMAERIKPIARTLIDLFDGPGGGDETLRLSRLDAPRLDELTRLERWQFSGEEAVQQLAWRLTRTRGVAQVAPPAGLKMELRPYQLEGLAWLQYLREQKLAGILADDMGLGKTAQTLAHLLLEKESGRLDKPALVVLPTSLLFNWKNEAARFAPNLRLLALHGGSRAALFPKIPAHDVVLTTYPLLWRDEAELAKHDYHLLILDEAQTVKNAASQAAQTVRRIKTRHRLCLTGTPLENHLGELWAQFDFLLPGFLGESKQFTQTWRTPIERYGDSLRREVLAKRVKPFMLRRRKEDVAKELPAKTQIIRTVELLSGQRDLYETVRVAMDKKVREEIASKGFARSQIVILDALLKLRQVCCDPRLLRTPAAQKVSERAKLDLLMGMLPELVEEGRRVLLFSQFTGMLDLIAQELDEAKIPFVMLTGDTRDRETVVRRFQAGEVPVFLISLKAGGVGLNLTAADTVIHYDPWWNPAAENQATDRAHRIGQQKSVFVYKLVVAGSIEEKILALQEKKAALAAGILSEDASGLAKFGASDIEALLAPLPG